MAFFILMYFVFGLVTGFMAGYCWGDLIEEGGWTAFWGVVLTAASALLWPLFWLGLMAAAMVEDA